MNDKARREIGFDRRIDIAWLDAAAGQVSAGATPADARKYLWALLEGSVTGGTTERSARSKTISVLSRVWITVPPARKSMREDALRALSDAPAGERRAIHWAMVLASYPFFLDVASTVGRLLNLHGELAISQLTRRITESWGDRSTLPRATQRVLRSMVQWGALQDGKQRGHYVPMAKPLPATGKRAELIMEGILFAHGREMAAKQLLSHPAIFPFDFRIDSQRLRSHSRIRLHRQGDQMDVAALATASPPAAAKKRMKRSPVRQAKPQLELVSVTTPPDKSRAE